METGTKTSNESKPRSRPCQRILVVDDIPSNVRLLTAYLTSVGYDVLTATSGEQALESVSRNEVDLVLLDVMMPSLDGFETCRQLKGQPGCEHLPVILVTSLNEVEAKVRGQQAGADDFVTKPFNRTELLVRVKSMLRIKSLNDQLKDKIEELQHAKNRLRWLADTDGLTSLHNRRYFEEFLLRELERAERYNRSVSLIVLDIDHFKAFNDSLGHRTGDLLLQQFASLFSQNIRNIDLASRIGGEEFAMVLLESGKIDAVAVAEKLRRRIAEHEFLDGKGDPVTRVTVSLGIATFPEDAVRSTDLIDAADRRLYRAKRLGRDRVVHSDD